MISILILTKNVEHELRGCLHSVRWSDDIHVFDSYSTDNSAEVARFMGATVTQRQFDNWSTHLNWGLTNISFRHSWVLCLYANERVSPSLAESMLHVVSLDHDKVAFDVRRRDFFMNKWLKHGGASPIARSRLFKLGKVRFDGESYPFCIRDGLAGTLSEYLDHFPFGRGIEDWIARDREDIEFKAEQLDWERKNLGTPNILKWFFAKTPSERRAHERATLYRIGAAPFLRFVYVYVIRAGILDGRPGLHYAIFKAYRDYILITRSKELAKQALPRR
jgi:glycosyltransferase involved in cell wall biosynthesis